MPPALVVCLALIGVLFSAAIAGMAYAQMQLENPEKDGYFEIQQGIAENVGLGEWARFQRSKAARVGSFAVSTFILCICLVVAAWNGYLLVT